MIPKNCSASDTHLNMNEVQFAESLITRTKTRTNLEQYKCNPVHLCFTNGNLEWDFGVEFNAMLGLDCSLKFVTNTRSTIWKVTLHLSVFFKTMDDKTHKEILIRNQLFDHLNRKVKFTLSKKKWDTLAAMFENEDREPNTSQLETMIVEAQICITNVVGFRTRMELGLDLCAARPESDLLFLFGTKRVFLNSGYLAELSPYFAATRSRMENMPRDDVTNLPYEDMVDVNHEEFVELMQIVHPSRRKITGSNVACILELADRFLFNNVLVDVERFLLQTDTPNHDVFTKLQWSHTYSMADLQDKCISQLNSFDSIKAVLKSAIYETIPVEILKSLFEKIVITGQANAPAGQNSTPLFGRPAPQSESDLVRTTDDPWDFYPPRARPRGAIRLFAEPNREM